MNSIAFIFDTGFAAVPLVLLAMLILGVWLPFYDFMKERKSAGARGNPLPGGAILLRNFFESQFLSYFLLIAGIMITVSGLFQFFAPGSMTPMSFVRLFAGIVLGGILMFLSQSMQRRFDHRVRNNQGQTVPKMRSPQSPRPGRM